MAPQIHKTYEYVCHQYSKTCIAIALPDNDCSLQNRVSDYSGGRGPRKPQTSESQRQPRWLPNYMRYELKQRRRTHSCGQDLTPNRVIKKNKKKNLKGSKKPFKVCIFWMKSEIWLRLWQLESDWLQISVPDGLYKCLRFQCVTCPRTLL